MLGLHLSTDQILNNLKADKVFAQQFSLNLRSAGFDFHSEENAQAWDLLNNACEGVRKNWWQTSTADQRFSSLLAIFKLWPCYTTSSQLFREFIHGEGIDPSANQALWRGILDCIDSDDLYIRDSIEYVLWVDFFEEQSTCQEAWLALTSKAHETHILDRLLLLSGPVPFKLKAPFYNTVARDPSRHEVLSERLARSHNDVFGKVDLGEFRKLFEQLQLPRNNRFVIYLENILSMDSQSDRKS